MSEDIFRIIYKSKAAHAAEVMLGHGHIANLLATARQRNRAADVSGVLVYTASASSRCWRVRDPASSPSSNRSWPTGAITPWR